MFGKLFSSMYDGTLSEDWRALVTFQQMLILCDRNGVIDVTPEALHKRTGIPQEVLVEGIRLLEAIDPRSRTPDEEGRRIVRLDAHRDWGWRIVNHEKYRNQRDRLTVQAQNRERQARWRERQRNAKTVTEPLADRDERNDNANNTIHIHIQDPITTSVQDPDSLPVEDQSVPPSSDEEGGVDRSRAPPVPYAQIRALYLEALVPPLSAVVEVKHWSPGRKRAVAARWKEHPSLADWEQFFGIVEDSQFLLGKNDRHWTATFDWLMNPSNFLKVIEHSYERED